MLVVCNGMFRSGSTLQYNLARELVERLGQGEGHGFFDGEKIRADSDEFARWLREDRFHVLKTHKVPPIAVDADCRDRVRVLYSFRDLRDVAVSLKRRDGYADCSDEKLLGILDSAVDIHHGVTGLPNALVQRYENLTGDLNGALDEIAKFLGLSMDSGTAVDVVDTCSLENAGKAVKRAKLRRRVIDSPLGSLLRKWKLLKRTYDPRTLLHGNHISSSRGASVWREALSEDEVELLKGRYDEWFKATGYAST